jgi:predicted DNA-binding protein (MmcQ/YjbR family)
MPTAPNVSTVAPDRLERLRAICLALPEATEKIAWGDPTWRVNDKIFAMQKGNYEGGRPSVWLKAPDGAQHALVSDDPTTFFAPPYVGPKGWIGIYLDGRIDWKELARFVSQSHRLVAPKKLARPAKAPAKKARTRPAKKAAKTRAGTKRKRTR